MITSRNIRKIGIGILVAVFALFISFLISKWIHSPLTEGGIKLYFADNITRAHQIIIDKFNRLHDGRIEIIPVDLPFSKFSTNERKELLARTLRSQSDKLDLFSVDVIWVPRFAKWSEPLDKYFPSVYQDKLLPRVLESCIYDSRLVAMPLYTDLMHLYFRKDIVSQFKNGKELLDQIKSGITWKQLIELGEKYKSEYPNFFIFPGNNFEGLMCVYFANLYSQKASFMHNGKLLPDRNAAANSMQILSDLVNRFRISPMTVTNMDEFAGYLYSLNNNGVFFIGWPGLLEQHIEELESRGLEDAIDFAPLPRFSSGETVSIIGGWNLMISKNSQNKEAAAEFIRFTILPENQAILNRESGFMPVIHNFYEDSLLLEEKSSFSFYYKLSEKGRYRPMLINYTQISDIFAKYIHLVIKGELSSDEAMRLAEDDLKTLNVTIE